MEQMLQNRSGSRSNSVVEIVTEHQLSHPFDTIIIGLVSAQNHVVTESKIMFK